MIFLKLFYEFFKIGLFSIGGGAATIPFLEELSTKTGWFTHTQLYNIIAVAESTPGAIGVNMATYVGYETAGILGGIIATLGLITPSIIIILIIAHFLTKFNQNKFVKFCFYGLRAASCALILAAAYSIFEVSILNTKANNFLDFVNWQYLVFAIILGFFIFKFKLHPVIYILISAVIGVVYGIVMQYI